MTGSKRRWTLTVDHLGRPTTTNAAHQMHHQQVSADRRRWREAGAWLARAARIPALDAISLHVWGRYPNRRSLPDPDALAPAVKGVLDGLVDAGVIPDDGPGHVAVVAYHRAQIASGEPAALIVHIEETGEGEEKP